MATANNIGIGSLIAQVVKRHYVYDISHRLTDCYEAPAEAVNGQACIRTRYQYDGGTARVVGSVEEVSAWDSAWDF